MPDEFTAQKPFMSDTVYNLSKKILTIVFPAFSALYLGLDALWNLPAEDQVVGTVALLATFLGVLLTVSSNRYTSTVDGDIVITEDPETGVRRPVLQLEKAPEEFENMDLVRFKVIKE